MRENLIHADLCNIGEKNVYMLFIYKVYAFTI